MSDFATEIGIIDETGQMPGVRVQGNCTNCFVLCLLPPCPAGKGLEQAVLDVLQRNGTTLQKVVQNFSHPM